MYTYLRRIVIVVILAGLAVAAASDLPDSSTIKDCEAHAAKFPPSHAKEATYISLGCRTAAGISISMPFDPPSFFVRRQKILTADGSE